MSEPSRGGLAVRGTPRRKRNLQPEFALQSAIIDYHASCVVDPLTAMLFAVPNGEKRDGAVAARLIGNRLTTAKRAKMKRDLGWAPPEPSLAEWVLPHGQGVLPGTVDLILLTGGAGIDLLEVKIPKSAVHQAGRLSKDQERFREVSCRLGHQHHIIRSLEDYIGVLRARDVALRASPLGLSVRVPTPIADPFARLKPR